jgi:hypothetical protein
LLYALNKVPCSGPDNRDVSPLGPEPFGSELKDELLEAEGQRDNDYYNLRLANPDYPDHSCAFIRA